MDSLSDLGHQKSQHVEQGSECGLIFAAPVSESGIGVLAGQFFQVGINLDNLSPTNWPPACDCNPSLAKACQRASGVTGRRTTGRPSAHNNDINHQAASFRGYFTSRLKSSTVRWGGWLT
jgi:hypothetical protein